MWVSGGTSRSVRTDKVDDSGVWNHRRTGVVLKLAGGGLGRVVECVGDSPDRREGTKTEEETQVLYRLRSKSGPVGPDRHESKDHYGSGGDQGCNGGGPLVVEDQLPR